MARRVRIIGLGGTIASGAIHGAAGVTPNLTAADLLEAVPAVASLAEIEAGNLVNVPSTEIDFPLLLDLAATIRRLEPEGFSGVVVTQGTDTIEETAFALDLLLDYAIPVAVTGAMRNPTLPGADGPANLYAAVACAADPNCRGHGVMVVFDDVIHPAAWVQKRDTSATGAFWSPSPLGWMAEGQPAIRALLPRRAKIELETFGPPLFVPILKPGIGDDPRLLDAALSLGAAGIVLDLSGGGHVAARWRDGLAQAAARVPVVFASRTRGGRVLSRTYGQPGAEIDLLQRGLVSAGDLDALKARVALILLLAAGTPERFGEFGVLAWQNAS